MSEYILIADDSGVLKATAEEALKSSDVKIICCLDVASAKRKLIQAIPCLIISSMDIGRIPEAGLGFCHDLREHSEFSKIPIVLVSEEVSPYFVERARAEGAKCLMPRAVSASDMCRTLNQLLPGIVLVAKSESVSSVEEKVKDDRDYQEKLQIAQHLLAKVLHNFKTSDLLHVIEKEDIPRVLYGITRTICGVTEPVHKAESHTAVASVKRDDYVDVDLDSAFGLKK